MHTDPATGKPVLEISQSGLNSFNSCPKRWAFRKVLTNFEETREESDATAVGTAMHEAIQSYMVHRNEQLALEALALHHPIALRDSAKANVYSLEASTWTFMRWLEESDLPGYEIATFLKDGKEIPAVELPFLVVLELPNAIFHLRGFIDLIVRSPYRGNYLPIDIKTTTPQSMATMEAKYKWDWQITSYGIPLNALLGLDGPFDAGIMAISMSDRSPEFKLPIYTRNADDIQAYEYYLIDNCRRIERYLMAEHFPRQPSACIQFGRVCPYHSICGASRLDEMQLLVNPSGKTGDAPGRPFEPVFEVRIEGLEESEG